MYHKILPQNLFDSFSKTPPFLNESKIFFIKDVDIHNSEFENDC